MAEEESEERQEPHECQNKMSQKKENLFTYLNSLFNKKEVEPFSKTTCSPYMLSMYLSHERDLINLVQEMNKIQFSLPDGRERIVYEYYLSKVPRGRRFIKWTKKDKASKKKEEQLEEIMEELDVSKLEADKIQRTIDAISKM